MYASVDLHSVIRLNPQAAQNAPFLDQRCKCLAWRLMQEIEANLMAFELCTHYIEEAA
jgi:hypothetical protein